jgi:hypothetical protein
MNKPPPAGQNCLTCYYGRTTSRNIITHHKYENGKIPLSEVSIS